MLTDLMDRASEYLVAEEGQPEEVVQIPSKKLAARTGGEKDLAVLVGGHGSSPGTAVEVPNGTSISTSLSGKMR
jgi:hypothetical protein